MKLLVPQRSFAVSGPRIQQWADQLRSLAAEPVAEAHQSRVQCTQFVDIDIGDAAAAAVDQFVAAGESFAAERRARSRGVPNQLTAIVLDGLQAR